MNDLEKEMHRVVDASLSACITTITETGEPSLLKEEVIGKSRKENALMTRTMMAMALHVDGFSVTTIAQLLGRSERAIRDMFTQHEDYKKTSNAYRIAIAEAKRKCGEKQNGGN